MLQSDPPLLGNNEKKNMGNLMKGWSKIGVYIMEAYAKLRGYLMDNQ